jgi:membrane protein
MAARPAREPEPRTSRLAEWRDLLETAGKRFMADDCVGLSQQIAYKSLLAFLPAMVALLGLLDLANAYGPVERFLFPVAPHAVRSLLETFRSDSNHRSSVFAVLFGFAGAIWVGSSAVDTIVKAVNRAFEHDETRKGWQLRLLSIGLLIAMGLETVAILLLIVFGHTLGHAIDRRAGTGGAVAWTWDAARWPLGFVVILLLIAILYSFGPNHGERSLQLVSIGSFLAGVLWLLLSGGFALFTAFSHSYTRTYGALAGAIVLLLWLHFSAWALLYGAEVDAELARRS